MIHWSAPKAVVAGISVLVFAQLLYILVLMKVRHHELLRLFLLVTPGLASAVTAYLAPKYKVVIGMSMPLVGSLLGVLFAFGYKWLGFSIDNIGGVFATAAILLLYGIFPSTVGTVAGKLISDRRSRRLYPAR